MVAWLCAAVELRPFNREGQTLAVGSVVGYLVVVGGWFVLARLGQTPTVAGDYAQAFTYLVLPALLMIPSGLTSILALLVMRCRGTDMEIQMLRLGGLFAVVFCVAVAAAFLAFFVSPATVLYMQAHVLATSMFCVGLALGCGQVLRRIGVFGDEMHPVAESASARPLRSD